METPFSDHTFEKLQYEQQGNQPNIIVSSVLHKMITDHVADSIYVMKVRDDGQFTYVFANDAALASINKSAEDVLGLTILQVLGSSGDEISTFYRRSVSSMSDYRYTDEVVVNGETRSYETRLTPIHDRTDGNYVVAVSRDITIQQQEKLELKKVKEHYSSLINHNLDPIFTLSNNGDIKAINNAVTTIFNYEQSGRSSKIEDFFHSVTFGKVFDAIKTTRLGQPKDLQSVTMLHQNGSHLTVHIKFVPIKLEGKVEGMYMIVRDATIETENEDQIRFLSLHDHLTGLWNKRALKEHLTSLLMAVKSNHHDNAVICLDLDRFKVLNDSLGYNIGDELLKEVAARLKTMTASKQQLYRLTADEFIFVIQDTDQDKIEQFVRKIIQNFNRSFTVRNQEYYISSCIGIALFPKDGNNVDSLINKASQALLVAKAKGKGHYRFYSKEMNDAVPNEVLMETHLRRAIELNEFTLHYQPQVNLSDGSIQSVEALLRWNNHKFGSVSPAQFIPLAEETGLILPIGKWVIDQACAQLEGWKRKGLQKTRVAINISPQQFSQENFDVIIRDALQRHNLDPSMLEIEITESAMGNMLETLSMLKKLKKIGVKISIDDFGTGYSSLNYLKKFPIDILKIDQSFVKEIQSDKRDAAITKTIIHLAHSLGMEVVAEGVEEPFQVKFLREEHCQKGQGYYFSKPVSSIEIEKHFKKIV